MAIVMLVGLPTFAQRPATQWNQTLDRISTGVVSIRVDSTRAFDTDWNQSTQATGFVVDAEQGLILTNRHVVTAGPVVAQAIFLNHEEVDLKPVYRWFNGNVKYTLFGDKVDGSEVVKINQFMGAVSALSSWSPFSS